MTAAEQIVALVRTLGLEAEVVRLLTSDDIASRMVADVRAVVREELRAFSGERSSELIPGGTGDRRTYYTVTDVATMFGVKAPTVRQWIKRGELGVIQLPGSRKYRVSVAEVQAFGRRRASQRGGAAPDLEAMADKIVDMTQRRAERISR
jgi:excisionase family DNA binding protein